MPRIHIDNKRLWFIAFGLLVMCVPVMQRFAVLPLPPFWDEGFYATTSMRAHQFLIAGDGLPPTGTLQLYSVLCSFVFNWSINHLVALRLCDMLVAAIMAWQVYRLLSQESRSPFLGACLALLVVFSFSLPLFAERGFKNAIPIALIPLFLALRLGLKQGEKGGKNIWFLCGVLSCLGILLRKSFAIFGLIGFCSIFSQGWRRAAYFAAGGLFTGIIIIGTFAVARGGFDNILQGYTSFAKMTQMAKPHVNTLGNFKGVIGGVPFLLLLAISCCASAYVLVANTLRWEIVLFWLLLTFAPLYEVAIKGGVSYTYLTSIIGLCGLLSTCCRVLPRYLACAGIALLLLAGITMARTQLIELPGKALAGASAGLRLLPHQKWPRDLIESSNFLLMSQAIYAVAKQGDTLLVSGYYYPVYVPAGLLPPASTKNHWLELHRFVEERGMSISEISQYIRSEQPSIIVTDFYRCT